MPRGTATTDGPDPVDVHVGKRLAARRLSMGMNQSQLGAALGVTFQQVQKYEKGTNRVSASMMHRAADALGVQESFFFEGLRGEKPQPSVDLMTLPNGAALAKAYRKLDAAGQKTVLTVARCLGSEPRDAEG